jgi:hypothetical protein
MAPALHNLRLQVLPQQTPYSPRTLRQQRFLSRLRRANAFWHSSKLPLFALARKFFTPVRRVKYNHVSPSKVQKNTLEKRLIEFYPHAGIVGGNLMREKAS